MRSARAELRHEALDRRLRANLGGRTVVDSTRPLLVWEPRRVVPSYAVPASHILGELVPGSPLPTSDAPVLHPGIPFHAHSTPGETLTIVTDGHVLENAGFRPTDADIAEHVILDFKCFDRWLEEDEVVVAHPRDPFHRVDFCRSSRHVRIEKDGHVLAESERPCMVFETGLPVRFYLQRRDVKVDLRASAKRTQCAYKGDASYWSVELEGHPLEALGWTYETPLPGAEPIAGLVAFFDERVDVFLDGKRRERPRGPLSAAILEEAGV